LFIEVNKDLKIVNEVSKDRRYQYLYTYNYIFTVGN